MRKYRPADAMHLLLSPKTLAYACDIVNNGAFAKASATTRDAFGMRVIDYVGSQERRGWQCQLGALFALPVEQFEAAMKQEPVRRSRVPKASGGMREIGVPTFLRRCVSNALCDVLTITSDRVLPSCVRAYRPGRDNAVRETILDIAEAVHDGRVRYYAKVDIRAYFAEMQWPAIETALRHYGYGEHFISLVMAAVKCPVVRRQRGRLVSEPITRGAQMGLAESSALANLVLFTLDGQLGVLNRRLVYVRYSDDLFVGGREKHEVVAAVRKIATWCRAQQMRLKGVERNGRLANLVLDIKKTKIAFLGAEIDHLGCVHMPKGKLQAKLSQLAHMEERIISDAISGVSLYGDGGGVDAYDAEDLHRSREAFFDYWSELDPRGIPRARLIMKRRIPSTSLPSDSERGTVWIARLWGDRTERDGGSGRTVHEPVEHSEGRPPEPSRRSPPATGGTATAAGVDRASGSYPGCHARSEVGHSAPAPISSVREVAGEGDQLFLTDVPFGDPDGVGVDKGSYPAIEKDASRSIAEGRKSYRFESQSSSDSDSSSALNSEELIDLTIDEEDVGSLSDPSTGASPPGSVFGNEWVRFVHAVPARVGGERVVVVGRCEVRGSTCRRIAVRVVRRCRPEAALVRQLTAEVQDTQSGSVVLGVSTTWLAKSLLQPHRRFRAPLLFGRVLQLHACARGRDVVLVAGRPIPELLTAAIHARIDALVRDHACRQLVATDPMLYPP